MDGPMRVLPELTPLNREYWTGGLHGELRIMRCQACGWWQHPPSLVCSRCLSRKLDAEPVSGRGTVAAFTINHQQWHPAATSDPYVIAIVELPEQDGLRQTTNIVNCELADVRIGMPVRVVFEPLEDVAIPLFEPDSPISPAAESTTTSSVGGSVRADRAAPSRARSSSTQRRSR